MKTVLITGASRGMGLAYVEHYLDSGWQVIAAPRSCDLAGRLAELTAGPHADRLVVFALDVLDEGRIAELGQRFGATRLDLVINNAGVSSEDRFGEWTAVTFEQPLRVNAVGPALVAQAVAPWLARGAKLVNISSGMGSLAENPNPDAGLDAYAVSKAALNMVTVRLAAKLPDAIVVSLNPGWVRTDMGGPDATDSIDDAVTTITQTIERLTLEDSGRFVNADGSPAAW